MFSMAGFTTSVLAEHHSEFVEGKLEEAHSSSNSLIAALSPKRSAAATFTFWLVK